MTKSPLSPSDFEVVGVVVEHPEQPVDQRHTHWLNRRAPSLWKCDYCSALANSPKPVLPPGWELVLIRRCPWWGEVHLVACKACKERQCDH